MFVTKLVVNVINKSHSSFHFWKKIIHFDYSKNNHCLTKINFIMKKSNFNSKHGIVSVLLTLFLISCSHDQQSVEVSENFNIKSSQNYPTYEYNEGIYTAGEIHNIVLNNALLNSGWENFEEFDDIANTIVSYIEETEQITYLFKDYDVFSNSQSFIDELNNRANLSSQEYRDLVNKMHDDLLHIGDYDDIYKIISIYKKYLDDSSLNSDEYTAFYNSLSVLEHSAQYWSSYVSNRNGNGGCGPSIALSDWGGAVTGAMFGGPLFAISGFVSAAVSSGIAAIPCL